MISALQQQQLEKYVQTFQTYAADGNDSTALQDLIPEFYHFVRGCKAQVENTLKRTHDLKDKEQRVAEGLLTNLSALEASLLSTSEQLGIDLGAGGQAVTADHQTQKICVNFEQCKLDSLKNIVIQAIRDTLNVEAPLAHSRYTVNIEADHSVSIDVIHNQ